MSDRADRPNGAVDAAKNLAAALDRAGCDYALGGALALGFWAAARGTLDVDLTLFLSADKPSACLRLLQNIGCELQASQALQSLTEHGFCQVQLGGRRVDVFLPTIPFYELARQRRQCVQLGDQPVMIWDAETLCVFKMMFFRRKDLADVEQILRTQSGQLDTNWVRDRLLELYGSRDPRMAEWEELMREVI